MNSCTDDINRLEIELEVSICQGLIDNCPELLKFLFLQEANSTFRILHNEATRRLKVLKKKLGSSNIEKSRPYHDAVEQARIAQIECQTAALKYQRANGKLTIIIL